MKKIILQIDGMTCSACSNGLEKYLNKQNGIYEASVNLIMANASVQYDENILTVEKIEEYVKQAGFKSLGEFREINIEKQSKNQKKLLIIFTILEILIIYISMGNMIGLPKISFLDINTHPVNYIISLCIFAIIFVIYGFDIIKLGFKNLIHRTPNMDTLVSIGVLSSLSYSIYSSIMFFLGNIEFLHSLYFESTATVIYFIKLGRTIEGLNKDKTKEAIQKLVTITPKKANIIKNGEIKEVTLDEIKKGYTLICRPGEKIAVDGTITKGKTHLDETFITGESRPAIKSVDDKVIAGSLNYDGVIEYKAERIGKESTVSEIVRMVVDASNTKPNIARLADKVAGVFVPIVMIIAILTFIVYLIFDQSFETALTTFVTILVVACPCGMGLAAPLAIVVSEGLCASNGILIKKSQILENAKNANVVVFDKTGTLTYGKLKVEQFINYTKKNDKEILDIVAGIEQNSVHPIGKTFKDYKTKINVENYTEMPGFGLKANVDGNEYLLGNGKILDKFKIKNEHKQDEEILSKKGDSIIYVIENNKVIALIGLNDIIREDSKETIKLLTEMNITPIMLSGDNIDTANKIAMELGIKEVIAGVLPKQKQEKIDELRRSGNFVIMCGDGINDCPSLAKADIGVSVNSSADIAMDSSDVIFTTNNLKAIVNLINISKKTILNIKQNLFWAFFYNSLMIPVAMGLFRPFGIMINPMIASLAMVLSSICVILNSLRLKKLILI